MPARRQRAGLGLPVADDAEDHEVRVVERRTEGVHEGIAELPALVDGPGRLGRDVTADPAGERELAEEPLHARLVTGQRGVQLARGPFEIGVGDRGRPAVPGPDDPDGIQAALRDHAVGVGVDEVQAGGRPPVAEEPRLDVLGSERLAQERVVEEVDLPDREVVRRPPVGIDPCELGRARRRGRGGIACGPRPIGRRVCHRSRPPPAASGSAVGSGPRSRLAGRRGVRRGRRSPRTARAAPPRRRRSRAAADGGPSGGASRAR